MMAPPLADSPLLEPPFLAGAKPHADPGVQGRKARLRAVLEVLEPPFHHGVEAFDDGGEAVAIATPSELSDSVLEAHQAFLTRSQRLTLVVLAEEVEPFMVNVHYPRLFGMERETELGHLLPKLTERRTG